MQAIIECDVAAAKVAIKQEILRCRLRPTSMVQAPLPPRRWLWQGFLGAGMVTMLTSQWKSGKTTLISILLQRMAEGGQLAGLAVAAGKAAVISEEGPDDWSKRCGKLGLGDHVSFFCRPFASKPSRAQWQGLLDAMLELRQTEGLDLVVIDSVSVFFPGNDENTAAAIVESLLPLSPLRALGVSILLVHHPKKGAVLKGQAARGSGALASFVDILIEKNWHGKPDEDDRRRVLRAFSRHEDTPRHLLLELDAAGTEYLVHEWMEAVESRCWHVLNLVLEDALERLTQKQILDQWPQDYTKPDRTTLGRALGQGVRQGLLAISGTGRRNEPFRYWLSSKVETLNPSLDASAEELDRYVRYCRKKVLRELGIETGEDEECGAEETFEAEAPVMVQAQPDEKILATDEAKATGDIPPPSPAVNAEPNLAPAPLVEHLTMEEDIARRLEIGRVFRKSRRLE